MFFLESGFKIICPLTCLRSPRKVFVDIRDRERYTYKNINLRVRHKKRDTSARNSLFLVSPFRKKEIGMIFNEKLGVIREVLLLPSCSEKVKRKASRRTLMFETINLLFFFCKSFCLFFVKKITFFLFLLPFLYFYFLFTSFSKESSCLI